jgi:heat shock protein HslJ
MPGAPNGVAAWAATAALLLAGCATQPGGGEAAGARPVVLTCDGGRSVSVTFRDGEAVMGLPSGTARLKQQPAGSGIHYAGDGQDLRGKGANLTWTDAAGVAHACVDERLAKGEEVTPAAAGALAGTSWTLVEFQSSDDAIGRVVPPNVERYTLHFDADGSLNMQLDCNRGMARWTATPTSADGGGLSISPGAMTRAMCEPGAIDTKLARDLSYVRSYTIQGGRLSLALEADAGIYLWAPGAHDQD